MATIYSSILVAHDETSGNDGRDLYAETGYKELAAVKLVDYIKKCVAGAHPCSILTRTNAVRASGTITFSSLAADDTITVSGVVFTAKVSPTGGVQFALGADDTEAAANAVVKINADTTLDGLLIATSALGVITLTALQPGETGNAITTAISAHGSVSGSGRLGSGTNGTTETTHYFGSGS